MLITNIMIVTAYCATGHTCANNKMPIAGITIAAPRCVPLGTHIYIKGIGDRIVQDRTAKRFDGRIDLFVGSRKEALTWGKRKLEVIIYYENETKH